MTMTTVTTAGAFACLGLASFGAVRQLGLIGSVGLVACLLASLHLIPLCFRLLPAKNPAGEQPDLDRSPDDA
jgi:predicted RND superfamily exporter protein